MSIERHPYGDILLHNGQVVARKDPVSEAFSFVSQKSSKRGQRNSMMFYSYRAPGILRAIFWVLAEANA